MRAGDREWPVSEHGEITGSWKLGRPVDLAWPKKGWGTPFSGFRFAVPELCDFKGKAIYLDSDMLLRADIAEVWKRDPIRAFNCCHPNRTDVSLIDCSWFKDKKWWPRIEDMKVSGWRVFEYMQVLNAKKAVEATLPWSWNDCDGATYCVRPQDSKLIHYTSVPEQPYRPYPDTPYRPNYPFCKNRAAGELWFEEYREAATKVFGAVEAERMLWKAAH